MHKARPRQTSLIVGLIGFVLHLHRGIAGLKIVQLTYDQQIAKENIFPYREEIGSPPSKRL